MPFYHVRIEARLGQSHDEVRLDLTADRLEQQFLEPYRKGRPITTGGKSLSADDIERIRITRTDRDSSNLRPTVEQELRNSPIVTTIPVEWYIADKGQDVTDEFITGPSGYEVEESNTTARQPRSTTSMRVFISHSDNDVEVAILLIELLQKALNLRSDNIRCTSVDGYRMPGGVSIDGMLRAEVHDAELLIGLITPDSLRSAYVSFELGARWGADKPMIPLLASGASPEDLEGPLSGINALDSRVDGQVYQLLEDVAKYLKLNLDKTSSYVAAVNELVQLSSKLTAAIEQQSINPVYPQLSEDAKELLVAATKRSAREILKAAASGGLTIQANGKSFTERGNARSEARWEQALEDLLDYGLVTDPRGKGQVFEVTHKGFQVADGLEDFGVTRSAGC